MKLWMPVTKGNGDSFVGILSDTSLDRDKEFMTRELLEEWALNKALPALANHDNRMEMLVGGWKNLHTVKNGKNTALVAEPFFLDSNPLAKQIKAMVTEAINKGLNVGISIGAIPHETIEKEIDGEKRKGYSKAELIEATWVPLQSNRNAFAAIAKSFDLDMTTKPEEEAKFGKKNTEAITMTEEEQKKKHDEDMEEEEEEDKSSELQQAKEAAVEAKKAADKCTELFEKVITQIEAVTKEVTTLKTKSVNLPKAEGPIINQAKNVEPTIGNMLKGYYG